MHNPFEKALRLNLEYQQVLKEQLRRIEQAQQRNNELQNKIRVILTSVSKKRSLPPQSIATNFPGTGGNHTYDKKATPAALLFFVDQDGNIPPDNPDTIMKKEYFGTYFLLDMSEIHEDASFAVSCHRRTSDKVTF
jgi:hypothetical protein